MSRQTLIDWARVRNFSHVSPVRVNTNGYMYVTFQNENNGGASENIYFGQRFQQEGGLKVGDKLPVTELYVTEVANANDEHRWKITDKAGDMTETLKSNNYQKLF